MYIYLYIYIGLQGACINNLMSIGLKDWDRDIVEEMFEERDKKLIFSIPLGVSLSKDLWYWKEEPLGDYPVKSAYKLLQRESNRWNENAEDVWKKGWKMGVPGKIKNFMWRALADCLPTMTRRGKRGFTCWTWMFAPLVDQR